MDVLLFDPVQKILLTEPGGQHILLQSQSGCCCGEQCIGNKPACSECVQQCIGWYYDGGRPSSIGHATVNMDLVIAGAYLDSPITIQRSWDLLQEWDQSHFANHCSFAKSLIDAPRWTDPQKWQTPFGDRDIIFTLNIQSGVNNPLYDMRPVPPVELNDYIGSGPQTYRNPWNHHYTELSFGLGPLGVIRLKAVQVPSRWIGIRGRAGEDTNSFRGGSVTVSGSVPPLGKRACPTEVSARIDINNAIYRVLNDSNGLVTVNGFVEFTQSWDCLVDCFGLTSGVPSGIAPGGATPIDITPGGRPFTAEDFL